jgi:myo-inositol-1(or 4)-monophosphatase
VAYVGAGWLAIYFAAALEVWDVAAGGLIVCEAGGRITGWQGEEWELERPAVLATNGRLHEAVLRAWESDAPPG